MRLELLLHTGNQIALVKPQNSLLRATVLTASPSTHRQKITFAKLDSHKHSTIAKKQTALIDVLEKKISRRNMNQKN